jgi:hypothetical protein
VAIYRIYVLDGEDHVSALPLIVAVEMIGGLFIPAPGSWPDGSGSSPSPNLSIPAR